MATMAHGRSILPQRSHLHHACGRQADGENANGSGAAPAALGHFQLRQPKPSPHQQTRQGNGHTAAAGCWQNQHPLEIHRRIDGIHRRVLCGCARACPPAGAHGAGAAHGRWRNRRSPLANNLHRPHGSLRRRNSAAGRHLRCSPRPGHPAPHAHRCG